MSAEVERPMAEDAAVAVAALLAGRIDGQQTVASITAMFDRRLAAERARVDAAWRARVEAWIRHGEAVPANVTTCDRWLVHAELRALAAESQEER